MVSNAKLDKLVKKMNLNPNLGKPANLLGKLTLSWINKADAGLKCSICNKSVKNKSNNIALKLNVVKTNIYVAASDKTRTLDFDFFIHKKCLASLLEECPYEEIKTLKELDLTQLDKP